MTQAAPRHDRDGTRTAHPPQHRRELFDVFRRMIVDRETAAMLEQRAEQSSDPALADRFHERAADHRLRAERARVLLVAEGVLGLR